MSINALEADSIPLLSKDVMAVHAKLIGYFLTPEPEGKGLISMEAVISHLKKNMDKAYSRIWDDYRLDPHDVSVDLVYVTSVSFEWGQIADNGLFVNGKSFDDFHHQARQSAAARSPEYEMFYAAKENEWQEAMEATHSLINEFVRETNLEFTGNSAPVGRLLIDVWRALTAGKTLEEDDSEALIVGVLRAGRCDGSDVDYDSLELGVEQRIRECRDDQDYGCLVPIDQTPHACDDDPVVW